MFPSPTVAFRRTPAGKSHTHIHRLNGHATGDNARVPRSKLKIRFMNLIATVIVSVFVLQVSNGQESSMWISAYYAGWLQGNQWSSHLPADQVDYSAVTHIFHFSADPTRSGGVVFSDIDGWSVNQAVTHAHNAGKKILISVGGWGSGSMYNGATSAANLDTFVKNLVDFIIQYGYDGIDLDWEPIERPAQFKALVPALRAEMDTRKPGSLLTIAAMTDETAMVDVHEHFDQINIMTYDMSGAWPGWVSWHNAPIFHGGFQFPSTGRYVPSADESVELLISRGVPKEKIGIGLDWYGYVWRGGSGTPTGGVTEPRQSYTSDPDVTANVPYYDIMDTYYQAQYVRWDNDAKAAYLSIDRSGSSNDMFISYDDETTTREKVAYVKQKGIGGLIIWELGGGYRPGLPSGQRDMLLQTVKEAAFGATSVTSEDGSTPENFVLSQNFPNPFNPSTTIRFHTPYSANVTLKVFDALGREIVTLVDQSLPAGAHSVHWYAQGRASGVYYYRLTAGNFVSTKKLILAR
jgi:chitinase